MIHIAILESDTEIISVMAPSAQEIYQILIANEPLMIKEIRELTNYSRRTVQQALRLLLDLNLVKELPDLHDLRRKFFTVA